jgi:hypothetical protein
MSSIVQPELDLDGALIETQWNFNEQNQANQWTEEARCLAWLCPGDSPDWEWWRSLRQYERDAWLNDYHFRREQFERGAPMPVAANLWAAQNARFEQTQAIAQRWSIDIRKAFATGKPCPIIPAAGFELALDLAITYAGIPKECLKFECVSPVAEECTQ